MKEKRPYAQVMSVASRLVERLAPACDRIEIAGSLRRQSPFCSDIEIVALPKPILNLIGEPSGETEVDVLLSQWPVTITKNGTKYKQFTLTSKAGNDYQVDLFLPAPECWAVILMIRTGSGDFSKQMVTAQSQGGYKPEQYSVREGRVWLNGRVIDVADERDLFDLWDMEFIEPRDRNG